MVDAAELPPSDEAEVPVAEPVAESPVVESEPVAAEAWFFATLHHFDLILLLFVTIQRVNEHFMVPSPLP